MSGVLFAIEKMTTYSVVELTDAQKDIIRDTVPTLKAAGEELTKNFYKKMLHDYPQVVPFFNQTDQKTLRQPKILAFALLKYAENIDDLTPLTSFVKQIVAKHVGLQVRAEDYECVGNSLIATMKEMLGEVATDEFVGAWAAAYGNLAALLIGLEADEYKKNMWQGFKEFKVSKMVDECSNVKSVYLTPVDGQLQRAKPGQYICIRWKLPGDDVEKSREYTVSEISDDYYRISVKKLEGGLISGYVHEQLKEGDILTVAPPEGQFLYKESDKPAKFIVGGIGITPTLAILADVLPKGVKAHLLYANHTADRPFVEKLQAWAKEHDLTVSEYITGGATTLDNALGEVTYARPVAKEVIAPGSEYYLLGPRPMMKDYLDEFTAQEITPTYEYYGPWAV